VLVLVLVVVIDILEGTEDEDDDDEDEFRSSLAGRDITKSIMNANQQESGVGKQPQSTHGFGRRVLIVIVSFLALYLLAAYVIAPAVWRKETRKHPDLAAGPRVTQTANGIPGDPVNIALLGSEADVVLSMTSAGWYPADAITFRSSVRIAVDSVFRRPDDQAPVSDLFLFGRKQDLAFEQPVGDSPRQRHHVRFWHWDRLHDGREVWFGSATFDERVGLSHTTGQITHHIGPDVDAERDRIMNELQRAGRAEEVYFVDGFHSELQGKNGGGDPWRTDGRLGVVVLKSGLNVPATKTNSPSGP
jgi:hypothetical protein